MWFFSSAALQLDPLSFPHHIIVPYNWTWECVSCQEQYEADLHHPFVDSSFCEVGLRSRLKPAADATPLLRFSLDVHFLLLLLQLTNTLMWQFEFSFAAVCLPFFLRGQTEYSRLWDSRDADPCWSISNFCFLKCFLFSFWQFDFLDFILCCIMFLDSSSLFLMNSVVLMSVSCFMRPFYDCLAIVSTPCFVLCCTFQVLRLFFEDLNLLQAAFVDWLLWMVLNKVSFELISVGSACERPLKSHLFVTLICHSILNIRWFGFFFKDIN